MGCEGPLCAVVALGVDRLSLPGRCHAKSVWVVDRTPRIGGVRHHHARIESGRGYLQPAYRSNGNDRQSTWRGHTVVAHLSRKDNHTIKIELDGYQPFAMTTTRKTSGWVWGNIVFGGPIGLAVDAISGGLYDVHPDHVSATLPRQVGARRRQVGEVTIRVVLSPDPSWRRIGTLKRR